MQVIPKGPHRGQIVDEPEYEGWSGAGWTIGVTRDRDGVAWLNTQTDRACVDVNEFGWMCGWMMECYDRGLVTKEDLDGVELTWGNLEAICKLLKKIAFREGVGDKLAEGLKLAPDRFGGGERKYAMRIWLDPDRLQSFGLAASDVLVVASGTATVLAVARAFASAGLRPRRSILFALFSAEEWGLFGSRWYVTHPIFPLEKTVAMINLDMIGRLRDDLEGREAAEDVDTSDLVRRIKLAEHGAEQPKQPKKLGTILVEEGIINEDAARQAEAAGLTVVMNRCMRATHRQLLGEQFRV